MAGENTRGTGIVRRGPVGKNNSYRRPAMGQAEVTEPAARVSRRPVCGVCGVNKAQNGREVCWGCRNKGA